MDSDVRTRDRVAEHWRASERGDIEAEHAIYAANAVLDYPQSGERFRGRANIQAQRGGHPAKRHFTIRRISGIGNLWVSECIITYDGVPSFSVSIMEFTEGYVTHETQYFGDKFEAASWRAPLAEPIPADAGEPGQPPAGSPLERPAATALDAGHGACITAPQLFAPALLQACWSVEAGRHGMLRAPA